MFNTLRLLVGSSIVAQIISVLSLPIIILYFDPENLGYFQLILSYAAILNSFSTLKLHEISFYYPNVNDRKILYTLALMFHVAFSAITVLIYLLAKQLTEMMPISVLQVLLVATISVGVMIVYTEANKRLISKEIAQQRIAAPFALNVTRLSLVNVLNNNINLLLSYVASQLCIIFLLLRGLKYEIPIAFPTFNEAIGKLKMNYKYFIPDTLAGVVSVIRENYIILVSATVFDLETAGYVAIANRLLMLPVQHISKPLLELYKHEIFEDAKVSRKKIFFRNLYVNIILNGMFFSVLFVLFSYFAALIPLSWRAASEIILLLLPLYAVRSVVSVMSYNFYVEKKQFTDFLIQLAWLLVLVAPQYLNALSEITNFLDYFVGVSALFYLIYAFMSWWYIK